MTPASNHDLEEQIRDALKRLDIVERAQLTIDRNQSDVAKSLTAIVEDHKNSKTILDQLKTDRQVREERDKNLYERLDRIEKSVTRIYNLGWWLLAAAGSALLLAVAKFIFTGGLNVG